MNELQQLDAGEPVKSPRSADVEAANQIDLLCDAFEVAWLRGDAPQIEEYLVRCDESMCGSLLAELLLVERELLLKQGRSARRLDYQRRFPQYSTIIDRLEFTTIDDRGRSPTTLGTPALAFAGTKLAHFELVEELGSGASGTVWSAKDTRLRRMVAIKIPRQCSLTNNERERFLREGQACAQLQHPSIVTVYEVGEHQGQVFIVAELIDGMNLCNWQKQRKPGSRESARLAAELAEALHHAHEQGVIHRDLKPANVLIDSDARPHIADFGLAKWTAGSAAKTVEGNVVGTPAYMSPEQARGDAFSVDRRTDVYGLGALLYELLTGQPLFNGDVAAIVHQVIHNEPQSPRKLNPAVPRDLETICLKAIEKEPIRRYSSAYEMAADLVRFLQGEPIRARRVSRIEQSWRWLRRRPAVGVSLLLTLAAAGGIAMAAMLANENYALLGFRNVALNTDPPGAKIIFVPLDEATGEPVPHKIIRAHGVSPVSEELLPGDYLVVAVHGRRFHEVFRRVPRINDTLPGMYRHNRWHSDSEGGISLPSIKIPPADVSADMAFIENRTGERVNYASVNELAIGSIFIDTVEFTVEDYRQAMDGELPRDKRWTSRPSKYAVSVGYDRAVALAEKVGKRLPSEYEYEFVATAMGQFQYPWGNSPHVDSHTVQSIQPVGEPKYDRLDVSPPVYGLCSNVAEWTSSPVHVRTRRESDSFGLALGKTATDYRIVKGGDLNVIEGKGLAADFQLSPALRLGVSRFWLKPGLGFRCVRSVAPRLEAKDFECVLPNALPTRVHETASSH